MDPGLFLKKIRNNSIKGKNKGSRKIMAFAFITTVLSELLSIYLSSKIKAKSLGFLRIRKKLLILIKVLQGFLCTLLYYKILEKFLNAVSPLLKKYYVGLLNTLSKIINRLPKG
jgi:hypothetical protein